MALIIEKIASKVTNLLLFALQVSVEKKTFGHFQGLVDSWLPDMDVPVIMVRTRVERVLPLHPQPSPYRTQPEYSLEYTAKSSRKNPTELQQPTHSEPTRLACGTSRTGAECNVREKTTNFLINPGSGADLRCSGDEGSDTNDDRRRNRYHWNKESDRKSLDIKSKLKKCSDPFDLDESDCDEGRDSKPDRREGQKHRRKTKICQRITRQDRVTGLDGFSGGSLATLSKLSDQSGVRGYSNSKNGKYRRKKRRSKLQVVLPLDELLAGEADYSEYELVGIRGNHQDLFGHVPRFAKMIDVQMRLHGSSGSDLITFFSLLGKFKEACNLSLVPELIAFFCFWLYVDEKAEFLPLPRLTERSIAVSFRDLKCCE